MTETTDSSVTLAGIRERRRQWHDAPYRPQQAFTDWAALVEVSAEDVPSLVAALEAVLALHSRWEIRDGEGEGEFEYAICCHCCAGNGAGQTEECADEHAADECWPCSTVRAITTALTGTPQPSEDEING